jgi:hypothetical protein
MSWPVGVDARVSRAELLWVTEIFFSLEERYLALRVLARVSLEQNSEFGISFKSLVSVNSMFTFAMFSLKM